MAVNVQCPQCARMLPVAQSLVGRNIKCPTCQLLFQAVAADGANNAVTLAPALPPEPVAAPQTPALDPAATGPLPAPPAKSLNAPCPFCAELIPTDVVRCPFCTEYLDEADHDDAYDHGSSSITGRPMRRDVEPHRGGVLMVFAVVSIVGILFDIMCPLLCVIGAGFGVAAVIMSNADLRKIYNGVMDPGGIGPTRSARTCAIVGLCLHAALFVICGLYWFALVGGGRFWFGRF